MTHKYSKHRESTVGIRGGEGRDTVGRRGGEGRNTVVRVVLTRVATDMKLSIRSEHLCEWITDGRKGLCQSGSRMSEEGLHETEITRI